MKKTKIHFHLLKSTLLLVLISSFFNINAQNNSIELFTLQPTNEAIENEYVRHASYLKLDQSLNAELFASKPSTLELVIPISANESMTVNLSPNKILADNFVVRSSDRGEVVDYTPGLYFKGMVNGDPKSMAAISIFEDHIVGVLAYNGETYVLGHLDQNRQPISSNYIFYKEADLLIQNGFECKSERLPSIAKDVNDFAANRSLNEGNCVNVYIETESRVFIHKGSVNAVSNYVSGFFNVVSLLFTNEQINTAMSELFVWTTFPNSTYDPYSDTDALAALNLFGELRQDNFNGDIAHLITTSFNNNGGLAWLDVLCQNYSYSAEDDYHEGRFAYTNIFNSYSNFPTYSWTVGAFTHEMGHNLGSPHTHACSWAGGPIDDCYDVEGDCSPGPTPTDGGTIMSYCHITDNGINFNNGFGPQPGDLIRDRVYNASCLGACTICETPTNIALEVISGNVARLTWDGVASVSRYRIRYRAINTDTWVEKLTAGEETLRFLNELTPSTTYQYQIKTLCTTNSNSTWSPTSTFTTSSDLCDVPQSSSAINIMNNSADLTWPANIDDLKWKIKYIPIYAPGSWIQITVNSNLNTLTNLGTGVIYKYKLKTQCAAGWTNWSDTFQFITTFVNDACPTVTNIDSEVISGNVAQITWDAEPIADHYLVRYRVFSYWNWTELNASEETFRYLNGLTPNTAYQYQIKTICTPDEDSSWSVNLSFTTSSDTCNIPESATTLVQSTSATATWSTNDGDLKWKIQYRSNGENWTEATINTNSYTMNGLLPNTTYEYKLKTKCAAGWTNWGAKYEFTTNASFGEYSEFSSSTSSIRLFPVPTQDQLNIDFGNEEIEQLNVFDVNGNRVFSTTTSSQQINTSNLSPGIYFLKLMTKNGDILSEKFIKE